MEELLKELMRKISDVFDDTESNAASLFYAANKLNYSAEDDLLSDLIDILKENAYFCYIFAVDKDVLFISKQMPPEDTWFYSAYFLYNPYTERFEKFYRDDHIDYPGWLGSIDTNEFYSCELSSITILDGIKRIGNEAFYASYELEKVVIPNSVTDIGENAFGDCSQLVNVTIGDGVKHIGEGAFEFCDDNLVIYTKNQYVINYCKKNDIKYQGV